MQVFEGHSSQHHAEIAIEESTQHWNNDGICNPDIIFAFHSSKQNPEEIATTLARHYPDSLIVGCTTAGEWRTGCYQTQSLILLAITSSKIRWATELVESLEDFNEHTASLAYNALLRKLNIVRSDLTPKRHFCIGLVDGIKGLDGSAVAAMANELGNIPFLGGMAGDDLLFEQTHIIANGRVVSGGAVFILAESDEPFKCIKHQHFVPGNINMTITRADETERRVMRLDGKPAAKRYADLLGLGIEDLGFQTFSEHPVIYRYGNESYVRSIQKANSDGSLTFYCAIEEGMVLNLCEHRDITQELDRSISELRGSTEKAQLMLMCNCVFRSLESEAKNQSQALANHAGELARHAVGFNTYGELWNGLHINQTLVALILGRE